MTLTVLEWVAFGGVLVSTWLYGAGGVRGPVVGALAAGVFIVYGFAAAIPAAWITNVVFLIIHARNIFKLRG